MIKLWHYPKSMKFFYWTQEANFHFTFLINRYPTGNCCPPNAKNAWQHRYCRKLSAIFMPMFLSYRVITRGVSLEDAGFVVQSKKLQDILLKHGYREAWFSTPLDQVWLQQDSFWSQEAFYRREKTLKINSPIFHSHNFVNRLLRCYPSNVDIRA